MTRLLDKSDSLDDFRRSVRMMGAKAERLNDIIQTMFKLMPNQRYAQRLAYAELALPDLLEDVYLTCQPFAEQRHQRLIIDAHEKVEDFVADRAKMRDILENLIMNAIKFTPDGGTVTVRVGKQLGERASLSVIDQGPGIAEKDLQRIFEPFYTGGDVLKHSTGVSGHRKQGMGLGLAVVKHFAELHGGDVRVNSTAQGCTFIVSIPLQPPPRDSHPAEPEGSGGNETTT